MLQIEIFSGNKNIITMNQTHHKKFHCIYLLHFYPFDTQESILHMFAFLLAYVVKVMMIVNYYTDC